MTRALDPAQDWERAGALPTLSSAGPGSCPALPRQEKSSLLPSREPYYGPMDIKWLLTLRGSMIPACDMVINSCYLFATSSYVADLQQGSWSFQTVLIEEGGRRCPAGLSLDETTSSPAFEYANRLSPIQCFLGSVLLNYFSYLKCCHNL